MKKKDIRLLAEHIVSLMKQNTTIIETEPTFLTIDEVAELIKLSKHTIYGYVHRNSIPYHKRERRLYFQKSEITDWLKSGKQEDKATMWKRRT